ncbi:hypothetical protein LTR28_005690, partial [Elasticomyces elasticus]
MTRSLTLIRTLDATYERLIQRVHNLTTTYALVPTFKEDRPDPVQLRKDVSDALERAERVRRMAVEESTRMADIVTKESRRLAVVMKKLRALPMPPSRDPTPEPSPALTSPALRRETLNLAQKSDGRDHMARATIEKQAVPGAQREIRKAYAVPRSRTRRILVPGEVLPPPNPDSVAPSSTISSRASSPTEPGKPHVQSKPPKPT